MCLDDTVVATRNVVHVADIMLVDSEELSRVQVSS